MNIGEWLKASTLLLSPENGTARLDAEVLLCDTLSCDRSWLLAHPEHEISAGLIGKLSKLINRRSKHEPLAYIRGVSEFYGREFIVNKSVLVPRPESEMMIELLRSSVKNLDLTVENGVSNFAIVDVGTGSGALAITAALELTTCSIYATDIDIDCLKVAKANAKKHKVDVTFMQGDLLLPIYNSLLTIFHPIILANLPYVPTSHTINKAAMNEPKRAIFGGKDGLDLYRCLFDQLSALGSQHPYIFTESLPTQHETLAEIAIQSGYRVRQQSDFIQVFSSGD